MTRALLHARQHAETCNGLECAAPEPVSAPYLQAAYERMKLPIHVRVKDWHNGHGDQFGLWDGSCIPGYGGPWLTADPAAATRIYFDLVAHPKFATPEPAPAILPDDAGGAQPDGAPAPSSFSPSAPSVSPDPGAVAGEVPPIANASPASDSGAR